MIYLCAFRSALVGIFFLKDCAMRTLSARVKLPELKLALDVETDEAFRWMLSRLLFKLDWLDKEINDLDARFSTISSAQQDVIGRLCTMPGVDRITAEILISELGADMTQFPTAAHAASWAGLCPGNAESAGKRFSGKTRKGSRYLRRVLVQSAWGAARTKDCFLAALFRKIAGRRQACLLSLVEASRPQEQRNLSAAELRT